jgi:superfamily II DNA helicase RecQ
VREKSKKIADTMPAMLAYIKTHPPHATGIVYCFSKKDCEKAASFLTFNKVRRGEEREAG